MTDAEMVLGGRVALVTGASRGIGRAVVEAFSAAGATVYALARSTDALEQLQREHGARPMPLDLTDEDAIWHALDELVDSGAGVPDIVVNAAGVFDVEPLASESVKGFDAQMAMNVRAPFLVIRALLPRMVERGSGTIVNIGSVAGRKAFPGNGAYSASKFGLRGLHEVLVEEIRGTGVSASLVEPAATDTSIWDALDPDNDPNLPGRAHMLRASDVADAVLFVASRPSGVAIPLLLVEPG